MVCLWAYFSGSAVLFLPLINVYCFDFWWKFLLFPSVLLERLILVFAWCILPLVYGVELAGLLEDPTFSVGMISGFTRGSMDLTYLVQNFV